MIRRRLLAVALLLGAFRAEACLAAPQSMVAAANPLAVEAGLDVLRRGGSAVDAAIAVQMVLGVVEPQASGIGGGGFLLHYDAASGATAV
ncbi:MAG TPA: gamma-glutamyltransferase, partial [Reyranella sp.]